METGIKKLKRMADAKRASGTNYLRVDGGRGMLSGMSGDSPEDAAAVKSAEDAVKNMKEVDAEVDAQRRKGYAKGGMVRRGYGKARGG
jgi:hypothetical protein